MQIVSIMLSQGFSIRVPSAAWRERTNLRLDGERLTLYWRAGRVLITIPTMDTNTKLMDMMDTILAARLDSGFSMRSQIHFWYLANLPRPKVSVSSTSSWWAVLSISVTISSLLSMNFSLPMISYKSISNKLTILLQAAGVE